VVLFRSRSQGSRISSTEAINGWLFVFQNITIIKSAPEASLKKIEWLFRKCENLPPFMESLFIARLQEKAIDFRDGNRNMATALHTWLPSSHLCDKRNLWKTLPFKTTSLKTAGWLQLSFIRKQRWSLMIPYFASNPAILTIRFRKASHRTDSDPSFTSVALKDTYYFDNYTSLDFFAPIQSLISPIQTNFTHIQSYSHVLL